MIPNLLSILPTLSSAFPLKPGLPHPGLAVPLSKSAQEAPPSLSSALQSLTQWQSQNTKLPHRQVRWPKEAFPLRVGFESAEDEAHLATTFGLKSLQNALEAWQEASLGRVTWTLAPPGNAVDISLRWEDTPTLGRDFEVGHTHRAVNAQNHITAAEITLLKAPAIDAHLSSEKQQQRFYATLLHELGHGLGLEHSTLKQEVMHHRGWQHTQLSEGDWLAIQQLYAPCPLSQWM